MATLPAASSFTGSTVTEAQFKTAITDQRTFLADLLGADGTKATALATLGSLLTSYVAKSTNYPVITADRGKLINCTAGLTLTTPAAATVGAGFAFGVRNSGAGTVILDGNASETVDGAATVAIGAGESALVVSTGTAWLTVGRTAGIADGSIVTAKLASAVGVAVYNENVAQTATGTYTDYVSQSITLNTGDALTAVGQVNFDLEGGEFGSSGTIGVRIIIDGITRATNSRAIVAPASYDENVTLSVVARIAGLSSGSRTASVQIYASAMAAAYNGSLLLIKEPT